MPISDLPVEIHAQILEHCPDLLDQINIALAWPRWSAILHSFKSLRRKRYYFWPNGVGIHKHLCRVYPDSNQIVPGEYRLRSLVCRVNTTTASVESYMYVVRPWGNRYFESEASKPQPWPRSGWDISCENPFINEPLLWWEGSEPEYSEYIQQKPVVLFMRAGTEQRTEFMILLFDLLNVKTQLHEPVDVMVGFDAKGMANVPPPPPASLTVKQVIDTAVTQSLPQVMREFVNRNFSVPEYLIFEFSGSGQARPSSDGPMMTNDRWVLEADLDSDNAPVWANALTPDVKDLINAAGANKPIPCTRF